MSVKASRLVGTGAVLVVAAVLVAAIATSEAGEELIHFYTSLKDSTGAGAPATGDISLTAMELQGRWRGMSLVGVRGPAARNLGLPAPQQGELHQGVAVADLARSPVGKASKDAGMQAGDVIMGIDRKPVADLPSLFRATAALVKTDPVLVDIRRQGMPMTLVLPPLQTQPTVPPAGEAREWEAPKPPAVASPVAPAPTPGGAWGGNGNWANGQAAANWQPAAWTPPTRPWGTGRRWGAGTGPRNGTGPGCATRPPLGAPTN